MPFLTPASFTIETNQATLTAPLVYEGRDQTFTVPAGASTDFASVPRFMTWLVPTMGAYTRAAVLHDWLCTALNEWHDYRQHPVTYAESHEQGNGVFLGTLPPASARDIDGIFRRVCRESGTKLIRRWLLWTGVRWGALFNPARRAYWWRDAPAVLAISAVALPFLLLPALFVGATLLLDNLLEALL